jgi:transcriptional regulator with XRE-family HTH domain
MEIRDIWKQYKTIVIMAAIFLPLSASIFFIHYLIFHDPHHIFIFLVHDLALIPLEVFLVVVVIERLLTMREKRELLQKLNMVIGVFYSEVGNYLLQYLLPALEKREEIASELNIRQSWGLKEFKRATAYCESLQGQVDPDKINLNELKEFFIQKRPFLLSLMENPNLMENERITDVLWAAFHLDEELECRGSCDLLPASDVQHIAGDIKRLYSHLLLEWLDYAQHLKARYPYLYSLVLRTHPFQQNRSPVVVNA